MEEPWKDKIKVRHVGREEEYSLRRCHLGTANLLEHGKLAGKCPMEAREELRASNEISVTGPLFSGSQPVGHNPWEWC